MPYHSIKLQMSALSSHFPLHIPLLVQVTAIALAPRLSALPAAFMPIFTREVRLPLPDQRSRQQILRLLLARCLDMKPGDDKGPKTSASASFSFSSSILPFFPSTSAHTFARSPTTSTISSHMSTSTHFQSLDELAEWLAVRTQGCVPRDLARISWHLLARYYLHLVAAPTRSSSSSDGTSPPTHESIMFDVHDALEAIRAVRPAGLAAYSGMSRTCKPFAG